MSHADVAKLTEQYFRPEAIKEKIYDPVIHFYEDFLNEYDPALRKKMGAYYTPRPVVEFIVKSVDEILKNDFNIAKGVVDDSKLENGLHRVQILDPATGTGTFISVLITEIYAYFLKTKQNGRWPAYVHRDLLPRIHGFELMMAPYTIAHLRLGIAFKKTGFWDFHRRLGIYLTNTLEEGTLQQLPLSFGLAESIAEESKEAAVIKNKTPIMAIIGNPPYSGISSNETLYANGLVEQYKVEPGGTQKLQERKHWLNDDYVKFIAYAENMIKKTGYGVVAMITNNGYLDNPTFRGMRWHLSQTFDKIYVLDLHGNAKKKEKAPDGSKDENIFDIMQGVGIILAVKTGKKKEGQLAEVYHSELYGTRKHKFEELLNRTPKWQKLTLDSKMLYFVPKNTKGQGEYENGFLITNLFVTNTTGIITGIDRLSIFYSKNELNKTTRYILDSANPYEEFNIRDGRKYKKEEKLEELRNASDSLPTEILYRPFDHRYMYYTRKSECWINSPRWEVMKHFINHQNIGLIFKRGGIEDKSAPCFITKTISECRAWSRPGMQGVEFNAPLYLFTEDGARVPNLNVVIVKRIEDNVGKVFPEDIFYYIYAVLHSPNYREIYKEFLKTDFPRVPYPKNKDQFFKLAKLGEELKSLHLLESPKVESFITSYPIGGSDVIEKNPELKDNNVYINDQQYFGNVSKEIWEFYIGGYQPAQRWLKDRKGQKLANQDLEHYQKIIVALSETIKVTGKIEEVWSD